MEKLISDLPKSDEEIRQKITEYMDFDHIPRTGGNPRANWEGQNKFEDLVDVFKESFKKGGEYSLIRTAVYVAKSVVRDSLEYYGDDRTPKDYEILGVAVGYDGLVNRFIRGAISEIFAERLIGGVTFTEKMDNAPIPQSGKSWEKAGWDVVKVDKNQFLTVQVKATSKKPSKTERTMKEADALFWLKVKKGKYYFRNAGFVE